MTTVAIDEASKPRLSIESLSQRPDAARIKIIQKGRWIPYPRAKAIHDDLEDLLHEPPKRRMRGMTIAGPSGSGKTTVAMEFKRRMSAVPTSEDAEPIAILHVTTPGRPDLSAFLSAVLQEAGDLRPDRGSGVQKIARILTTLPARGLRMIFVDEIQNVLGGGPRQMEGFLNTLKQLADGLQIPMVLIGTEKAINVLRTDPQLYKRFPPYKLPAWPLDAKFEKLVTMILETLPIQHREPLPEPVVRRLHKISEGLLGELVELMQYAAIAAIRTGTERIDKQAINIAGRRMSADPED